MAEHKQLYIWSLKEAVDHSEKELWRESHRENCKCADSINEAIYAHYENNCLHECAKDVIEQFGFNRVNWVLANTIQCMDHDGRFSAENRNWANKFYIPKDENRTGFIVTAHPGLVDLFTDQTRKAWQELGLFETAHCLPDDDSQDYHNKIVAIDPNILKDEYKTPEDQLFYADGGFGASPNSRGRKVFGYHLKDGEKTHYNRQDILGVVKEECLPEWAVEKIAAQNSEQEQMDDLHIGGM